MTTAARPAAGRAPAWSVAALPVEQVLALAVVATLPFAWSLTVDLRFPFKLYELALIVAAVAACANGRLRAAPGTWKLLRPLWLFVAFAAAVLTARALWPLPTAETGTFTSRFGTTGDGVAKSVYVLLGMFAFVVCSHAALRSPALYVRVWLCGALAASVYAWYLFASSFLGIVPPLLPGSRVPQYLAVLGHEVIRSGPFQEGNHLGLYLVCSTALAIYARQFAAAALFTGTAFVTFSTVNVIALALLWLRTGWAATARFRGTGRVAAALSFAGLAAAALLTLASTGYAAEVVFNKLGSGDSFSRGDRLNSSIAGVRMTADYPVAGVGISQYGPHYKAYQVTNIFDVNTELKPVANNVYVELLSETGVVGTACMALFWLLVYRRSRGPALMPLRWGLIGIFLVFTTFPSYTMIFLWAYWALITAAAGRPAPATRVARR